MKSAPMVRFYDVTSGEVASIPRDELPIGSVRAEVAGVDGVVWLAAADVQASPIRHPTFAADVRAVIASIQATFAEHDGKTAGEWEAGFQRDANPGPEIAVWDHAAELYRAATAGEPDPARRRDVFRCLIACLLSGPDDVDQIWQPLALSPAEARAIVDRFFARPRRAD